jgi:hypothetical protein
MVRLVGRLVGGPIQGTATTTAASTRGTLALAATTSAANEPFDTTSGLPGTAVDPFDALAQTVDLPGRLVGTGDR